MGTDARLIGMLSPVAADYGISLSLFNIEDGYSDAIILIGSFSQDEIEFYLNYTEKILFVNELENDYTQDSIMIDYNVSPKIAYEYFRNKGISKIGYYGGIYESSGHVIGKKRIAGFKEKLEADGIYNESFFHIGKMSASSGRKMMENTFELPKPMSAMQA